MKEMQESSFHNICSCRETEQKSTHSTAKKTEEYSNKAILAVRGLHPNVTQYLSYVVIFKWDGAHCNTALTLPWETQTAATAIGYGTRP